MGIFSKNDSIEYVKLEKYAQFIEKTLSFDEYISRKDYIVKKDELKEIMIKLSFIDNMVLSLFIHSLNIMIEIS